MGLVRILFGKGGSKKISYFDSGLDWVDLSWVWEGLVRFLSGVGQTDWSFTQWQAGLVIINFRAGGVSWNSNGSVWV